jgi:phage recombination protein Bet
VNAERTNIADQPTSTVASPPSADLAVMPRPHFDPATKTIEIPTPLDGKFLTFAPGQRTLDAVQMVSLAPLGIKANWDPAYVIAFLVECHNRGLDPWAGEAYLMLYPNNKYVRHIGIAGFRRKAEETGEYEGSDQAQYCDAGGEWLEVWPHRDQAPYAAKMTVHRRGHLPATVVALYDEYCPLEEDKRWDDRQGRKVATGKGKVPTPMWRPPVQGGKPTVMLAKCAEAAAFRRLFPRKFNGFYEPAEFEASARTGGQTVDGADVGAEVIADTTADGGDQDGGRTYAEAEVRAMLLAELDAQARLIGRDRAWMTSKWSASRGGATFEDTTVATMTAHVHRFRVYVVERLRTTGHHQLAERYHAAPLVGTLAELFGHDQPWTVVAEQALPGDGHKTTDGAVAVDTDPQPAGVSA